MNLSGVAPKNERWLCGRSQVRSHVWISGKQIEGVVEKEEVPCGGSVLISMQEKDSKAMSLTRQAGAREWPDIFKGLIFPKAADL